MSVACYPPPAKSLISRKRCYISCRMSKAFAFLLSLDFWKSVQNLVHNRVFPKNKVLLATHKPELALCVAAQEVGRQRTKLLVSCLKHTPESELCSSACTNDQIHPGHPQRPLGKCNPNEKKLHSWLSLDPDSVHSKPERVHPGTESAFDCRPFFG